MESGSQDPPPVSGGISSLFGNQKARHTQAGDRVFLGNDSLKHASLVLKKHVHVIYRGPIYQKRPRSGALPPLLSPGACGNPHDALLKLGGEGGANELAEEGLGA